MSFRVALVIGSLPCDLGAISWTDLPSALTIALPTVGSYRVPPLEIAE